MHHAWQYRGEDTKQRGGKSKISAYLHYAYQQYSACKHCIAAIIQVHLQGAASWEVSYCVQCVAHVAAAKQQHLKCKQGMSQAMWISLLTQSSADFKILVVFAKPVK